MGWRERLFPWYPTTLAAPAVDDERNAQESQGNVHHERRGKSQERHDALYTLKLPSNIQEAPLEYVFHYDRPAVESLTSTN